MFTGGLIGDNTLLEKTELLKASWSLVKKWQSTVWTDNAKHSGQGLTYFRPESSNLLCCKNSFILLITLNWYILVFQIKFKKPPQSLSTNYSL